jgi:hypothetical protein
MIVPAGGRSKRGSGESVIAVGRRGLMGCEHSADALTISLDRGRLIVDLLDWELPRDRFVVDRGSLSFFFPAADLDPIARVTVSQVGVHHGVYQVEFPTTGEIDDVCTDLLAHVLHLPPGRLLERPILKEGQLWWYVNGADG